MLQVYQFYKKYQIEHEKKFPSKGEALEKRWEAFRAKQEQAAKDAKEKAKEIEEKGADEPKVQEVKKVASDVQPQKVQMPPKQEERKPEPAVMASDVKTSAISTYNGAALDKYNWSQSTTNVDMQIPLPKGTVAKMMDIVIKPKHLKVQIKGQKEPIINGELQEKVKPEDTFWNIED